MPARAADTAFDLVAVDAEGKQIARLVVDYSIVRITYDYQWYQSDGRWRWQSMTHDREVDAGTLALKADAPVSLTKRLQWGTASPHGHRQPRQRPRPAVTFYVGWYGGSGDAEDAPDTLKVASDRQKYAPGDTAKLRIEAPFAGEAIVAIATDRVLATYSTQVAGRRHDDRHPDQGRMGRRRLCAGHRLAAARLARRAHARARHRRGLARPRSHAAHARRRRSPRRRR